MKKSLIKSSQNGVFRRKTRATRVASVAQQKFRIAKTIKSRQK
jgi:hypothetical protein